MTMPENEVQPLSGNMKLGGPGQLPVEVVSRIDACWLFLAGASAN